VRHPDSVVQAIATATMYQINGLAPGSTNHQVFGEIEVGDTHAIDSKCPIDPVTPQAGTDVYPVITKVVQNVGLTAARSIAPSVRFFALPNSERDAMSRKSNEASGGHVHLLYGNIQCQGRTEQ
jgi:hypothetical protein